MSLARLPSWALTLLALLPALVLMAVPLPEDMGQRAAIAAPALLWLVAFAFYAWVRLDEAGREAHKFAWFWGGAFGLLLAQLVAVGIVVTPLVAGPVAAFMESRTGGGEISGEAGFVFGVFACAVIQVLCYGLVWTGWWLSKRFSR